MTSDNRRKARDLYEAALRRDPEERGAFLDGACDGKPSLRVEVAALLEGRDPTVDGREPIPPPLAVVAAAPDQQGSASLEGRTIGSYIIRQEIGRGGMGVVYLADDIRLSRRVALKALAPGVSRAAEGKERLRREARAAATLSHPGIATVYALEEIGDEVYLAFEYVPGRSLRALLQSGALPISHVVEIAGQISRAMAAAHAHGVVHRDLKPENVIQTPAGVVKILDFGLARFEHSESTHLTQTGFIAGTPAYMSPEQARGEDVDSRSDVFSFGLLIYEMVAGTNPFSAGTITGTITRILEVEPLALARVRSDCPPELGEIVATCLKKDPGARYKSTDDLAADCARLDAKVSAHRGSDAVRANTLDTGGAAARLTPQWWWSVHQTTVTAIYALMLIPAWHVESALRQVWGRSAMVLMLGVVASAVAGVSLRTHLLFISRFDGAELRALHARTLPWLRWSDGLFAALLVGLGVLGIDRVHVLFVLLLLTVATAMAVAAFVIEPATTQASFRASSSGVAARPPSAV